MKIHTAGLALLFTLVMAMAKPTKTTNPRFSNSTVPALSYHNVTGKTGQNSAYFITPESFEAQIDWLKKQGFLSVTPEDITGFYTNGQSLPAKPILLSFDDTRKEHFTTVAPILEKYGFRGTFFIMTVSIGKKNYMSKEDIKDLADRGHAIGLHTWDHQDLRNLPADQWEIQIDKPKCLLEKIIGKPVLSFAYPFGLWNPNTLRELKERGITTAFQLSGRSDPDEPLLTKRRILVSGNWSGDRLIKEINSMFLSN